MRDVLEVFVAVIVVGLLAWVAGHVLQDALAPVLATASVAFAMPAPKDPKPTWSLHFAGGGHAMNITGDMDALTEIFNDLKARGPKGYLLHWFLCGKPTGSFITIGRTSSQ